MIVLLNGSFGIGKTSVARALVRRLPRSVLVDPEWVGLPLQWLGRSLGWPVGDFQDLKLWRRLTVALVRLARRFAPNVVVPMAFSNASYMDEIRSGIRRADARVVSLCLVAPLEVVHARLRRRGADPDTHPWEFRRAVECCEAHRSTVFGRRIDASEGSVEQLASIALDVAKRDAK